MEYDSGEFQEVEIRARQGKKTKEQGFRLVILFVSSEKMFIRLRTDHRKSMKLPEKTNLSGKRRVNSLPSKIHGKDQIPYEDTLLARSHD